VSSTLTALLLLALIAAVALGVERGRGGIRELSLIATLGAAAAAGRVLFAPIPSVTPVTVICLAAGAALGARAGAAIGALAALISNTFLGHGPWTLPQMALWAAVGASGALLGPIVRSTPGLIVVAAAWGVAFGWAMNLWFIATFGPEVSLDAFLVASARSVPFEVAGAVGNAVIALAIGPALTRMLARYAARIRVDAGPSPPARPATEAAPLP
jgi:energy-coupling factor transport system substrate-specific component